MNHTAFLFPGQGSQEVGMLADLARADSVVETTFAEASETLGYDLWQRVSEGPAEALNRTACTQPAMLTAGVAVWRVWRGRGGPAPAYMGGHSLGDYTALVCAEAIDFQVAVALVERRGELMQAAVPEGHGAMAAIIGLEDAAVEEVCADVRAADDAVVVEAVNYNAPGQVVIAGSRAGVTAAMAVAKTKGARRALPLPVSVPAHSALMRPAAEAFATELAAVALRPPLVTGLFGHDGEIRRDPGEIREALARQLHSPVRWTTTIRALHELGVSRYVECGPGSVLTGLVKRTLRGEKPELGAISRPDKLAATLAALRDE